MTNALPNDSAWTDYLHAHGGPEASGWWVTLRWFADSVHPRPEVVGPYSSYEQAVATMQDSPLIDGFAEDTNRNEWLDDVYVATDPASIAKMCAGYGHRVTLIDPGDPSHFGDPTSPAARCRLTASRGLLNGPAHCSHPAWMGAWPDAEGARHPVDRSPARRAAKPPVSTSISLRGVRSDTAAVASPGMATTWPVRRPAGGPR